MDAQLNLLPSHLKHSSPALVIKFQKLRAQKLEKLFDKKHIMNIGPRTAQTSLDSQKATLQEPSTHKLLSSIPVTSDSKDDFQKSRSSPLAFK